MTCFDCFRFQTLHTYVNNTKLLARGLSVNLPGAAKKFIDESASLCKPDNIHICDGSIQESKRMIDLMLQQGTITPLPKYENCWLARTNPADVARVESKTFICTNKREDTIPTAKTGRFTFHLSIKHNLKKFIFII